MVQMLTAKYGELKDKHVNYKKVEVDSKKYCLVLKYMTLKYCLKCHIW